MKLSYRRPHCWLYVPRVIGDPPVEVERPRCQNVAWENARRLRQTPTAAEKRFEEILNELGNGVLRGQFFPKWVFADKWILDFFFKNRLGIEVDGSIHRLPEGGLVDGEKEKACKEWRITLLRIKDDEIFGDREALVEKLREGWRAANRNIQGSPFAL